LGLGLPRNGAWGSGSSTAGTGLNVVVTLGSILLGSSLGVCDKMAGAGLVTKGSSESPNSSGSSSLRSGLVRNSKDALTLGFSVVVVNKLDGMAALNVVGSNGSSDADSSPTGS